MALFKIFKGEAKDLPEKKTEGYAYFTTDEGMLYIDISGKDRVQVNAKGATQLIKNGVEGPEYIEFDDVLTTSDVVPVENGGTGLSTLTLNGILVGNGTENVKLVVIENDKFVIGSSKDGITGIDAATALEKLNAYDKDTMDTKMANATTKAYDVTLTGGEGSWTKQQEWYGQSCSIPALKCGGSGNVPPLVTYVENLEEYSKIDHADATIGVGVTFYCKEAPSNDIKLIVIDQM